MNRLARVGAAVLLLIAGSVEAEPEEKVSLQAKAGEVRRFPIQFLDLPRPVDLEIGIYGRPLDSSEVKLQILRCVNGSCERENRFRVGDRGLNRPLPYLEVDVPHCSLSRKAGARLEFRLPSDPESREVVRGARSLDVTIHITPSDKSGCGRAYSIGFPAAGFAGLLVFGFIGYGLTLRRHSFFRIEDLARRILRLPSRGSGDTLAAKRAGAYDAEIERALRDELTFWKRARAFLAGGLLQTQYEEILELVVDPRPGSLRLRFRLTSDHELPRNRDRSRGKVFLVAGRRSPALMASALPGGKVAGTLVLFPNDGKSPLGTKAPPRQDRGKHRLERARAASDGPGARRSEGWLIHC